MIQRLELETMREIYNSYLAAGDFPAAEVKPFKKIEEMYKREEYFGYGLYEGGELLAYAFLVGPQGKPFALMDYYAVLANGRGCGTGTKFLELLGKELSQYDNLIFEVENLAFAVDEEDRRTKERRISFYERAGLRHTGLETMVFGVEYVIMTLPVGKKAEELMDGIEEQVEAIYQSMFSPETYAAKTRIGATEN